LSQGVIRKGVAMVFGDVALNVASTVHKLGLLLFTNKSTADTCPPVRAVQGTQTSGPAAWASGSAQHKS